MVENDLLKQILLFKVKQGKQRQEAILKIYNIYVCKIINKARRDFFLKKQKYKVFSKEEFFFEESDFKSESFICLSICLEKFDAFKQIQNENTFYSYFSISIKRYFERILNKLFIFNCQEISFDKSTILKNHFQVQNDFDLNFEDSMNFFNFNIVEKFFIKSKIEGFTMKDFCKKYNLKKVDYLKIKTNVEIKILKKIENNDRHFKTT